VLVGVLAGALVLAACWYYLRRRRNETAAASAAADTARHLEMGHLSPSIQAHRTGEAEAEACIRLRNETLSSGASAASDTARHIEMGHLPPSIEADGSTLVQQQMPAEHIPPPPPRPPLPPQAASKDTEVPAMVDEAEDDLLWCPEHEALDDLLWCPEHEALDDLLWCPEHPTEEDLLWCPEEEELLWCPEVPLLPPERDNPSSPPAIAIPLESGRDGGGGGGMGGDSAVHVSSGVVSQWFPSDSCCDASARR
jgi:hypothetical protein